MKLLLVLLVTPVVAFANLGDNESQCGARYGGPIKTEKGSGVGDKMLFFEKGGLGIGAEFWKGEVACMFYKKTIRTEIMSEPEIEALLEANRADSYWESANIIGEGRRWARKDSKAIAHFIAKQNLLIIMTDTFALQRMKNKAAAGQPTGGR